MANPVTNYLIPANASLLRGSLNLIADWSERDIASAVAARAASVCIPLFALLHVPVYLLRGQVGALYYIIEGEPIKGAVKFQEDFGHALQLLAFTVASIAWSILGVFLGSYMLTLWKADIPVFEDPLVTIEKRNTEIAQLTAIIGQLRQELAQSTAQFERTTQELNTFQQTTGQQLRALETGHLEAIDALRNANEAERSALIEKLEFAGAEINKFETALQAALLKQEELENEVLESLEIVLLPRNLGLSGVIATPDGNHAAFDPLLKQLLEGPKDPIKPFTIIKKNGHALVADFVEATSTIDRFTSSVLTFMLIKGCQRYQDRKLDSENFKALLQAVETFFNRFPNRQTDVEYQTLEAMVALFKTVHLQLEDVQLHPRESVAHLLEQFLNGTAPHAETVRHPYFRSDIVLDILFEKFGEPFVDEIANYYSYPLKKGDIKRACIWSEGELAMLIVAIAANLDLPTAQRYLNTTDEKAISDAILTFRRSAYAFAQSGAIAPPAGREKQFKKDLKALEALERTGTIKREELPETAYFDRQKTVLALAEHMARDLGYGVFDPGFTYYGMRGGGVTKFKEKMLIGLSGMGSESRLYEINLLVRAGGVYGIHLLPVTVQEDDVGFVIFRGTHDLASICRDIALWERRSRRIEGPGAGSFAERRDAIVNNWNQQRAGKGIKKYIIVGHSLGGSDGGRFLSEIVSDANISLNDCEEITALTFNAPHVETHTNAAFLEGISKYPTCMFWVFHLEGSGDLVSVFGGSAVAANGSSYENLTTETIVLGQPEARNGLKAAHTYRWFTKGGDPQLSEATTRRLAEAGLKLSSWGIPRGVNG